MPARPDDAIAAFDKCIAADPNRADAYYQKGVNLMGKATLQGDKMIAPPGTAEAFQKYLELAPTGPNAQSAKDMLASIGASVETSFGKKKPRRRSSYFRTLLVGSIANEGRLNEPPFCVFAEAF